MCFPGNVEIKLNSVQKPKVGQEVVSPKKLSQRGTISRQVRCSRGPEPACSSPAPGQWSTEDEAVKQGIKLLVEQPPTTPSWHDTCQGTCFPAPLIHFHYRDTKHPLPLHSTCKVRLKTPLCNKKEHQDKTEEYNNFYRKSW